MTMMAFPAATTRPTTTFSFHLTSPGKSKPQPQKLTSSSLLVKPSGIRLSCARSVDVSKEDSPTQQQQPPQQLPEEDSGAEASAQAFDKRRLEEKFAVLNTGIYECRSCGYKYDESLGDPLYPIPPGLPFNKMPEDWRCPTCGAAKSFFESKSVEIAGFAQNQQFGFGTNTLTSGQKAILIYGSLLLFFILFLSRRRLPHSTAFGAVDGRINSAFVCADTIQPILYNTEDQTFTTLLKLDG